MGRLTTFIYSALIIIVSLDTFFTEYIPPNYLPIIVIILGFLVLITPTIPRDLKPYLRGYGPNMGAMRSIARSDWMRRWIIGILLILLGIASMNIIEAFDVLGAFTLDTFTGRIILLLLGIIYLIGTFWRIRKTMFMVPER